MLMSQVETRSRLMRCLMVGRPCGQFWNIQ